MAAPSAVVIAISATAPTAIHSSDCRTAATLCSTWRATAAGMYLPESRIRLFEVCEQLTDALERACDTDRARPARSCGIPS